MENLDNAEVENTDSKYKVSDETARAQMDALIESYKINLSILPEDQKAPMEYIVEWLIEAIRTGKIEIQSNNTIKHHLETPRGDVPYLIYMRLSGPAENAYAANKNIFDAHMAQMGSLCNLTKGAMASLDATDRSVAEKLSLLFTSV